MNYCQMKQGLEEGSENFNLFHRKMETPTQSYREEEPHHIRNQSLRQQIWQIKKNKQVLDKVKISSTITYHFLEIKAQGLFFKVDELNMMLIINICMFLIYISCSSKKERASSILLANLLECYPDGCPSSVPALSASQPARTFGLHIRTSALNFLYSGIQSQPS